MESNQESLVYYYEDFERKSITDNKNVLYKITDIAKILGISDQTVKKYCGTFQDFLNTKHRFKQKRNFTENDLQKFIFIEYLLKDKSFTIKEAKEYLATPQGKKLTKFEDIFDVKNNKKMELLADLITIKLTPVLIETITNSMHDNLDTPLQNITNTIQESRNDIKNEINSLADLTNNNFQDVKEEFVKSKKISIEWSERIDSLIQENNRKTEQFEALQKSNKNKGFFNKLFKRRK